jgi:ATP-dependent NAD(P)H-hydrate dehydratase
MKVTKLIKVDVHKYFDFKSIIPTLSSSLYKGSMGRIAIIGGSTSYTGAPYYSGQSALKFGADLAFIFCSHDSAIPIKCYSPELMVLPFDSLDDKNDIESFQKSANVIIEQFPRIHSLCIGPGLGRNDRVQYVIHAVIKEVVIDADALAILSNDLSVIRNYPNCILTPNKPEFERLLNSAINEISLNKEAISKYSNILSALESTNEYISIKALADYLQVTVFKKGKLDLVSSGNDDFVYMIQCEGTDRRCGGQVCNK